MCVRGSDPSNVVGDVFVDVSCLRFPAVLGALPQKHSLTFAAAAFSAPRRRYYCIGHRRVGGVARRWPPRLSLPLIGRPAQGTPIAGRAPRRGADFRKREGNGSGMNAKPENPVKAEQQAVHFPFLQVSRLAP